jgi:hypothetical protein
MSTKVTISWRETTPTKPGFHLYWDSSDSDGLAASTGQAPVYLHIEGVGIDLQALARDGASVTIALPQELARELGLLPGNAGPDARDSGSQSSLFAEGSEREDTV